MKISQLAKPSQAIEGLSRVVDELRDNVNRNIGDYQTRWGDSPFFEPGLVQAADFKLKTPGEKAKEQEISPPQTMPLPPVEMLKEGHVTTMKDGTKWVLRNGIPVKVD